MVRKGIEQGTFALSDLLCMFDDFTKLVGVSMELGGGTCQRTQRVIGRQGLRGDRRSPFNTGGARLVAGGGILLLKMRGKGQGLSTPIGVRLTADSGVLIGLLNTRGNGTRLVASGGIQLLRMRGDGQGLSTPIGVRLAANGGVLLGLLNTRGDGMRLVASGGIQLLRTRGDG